MTTLLHARRQFLSSAGALAATFAVGCAARAPSAPLPSHRNPYRLWEDVAEGRIPGPLGLVAAATLASNPHNTQAWRFHVAPDRVDVFADPRRHLGALDPHRREQWLGLGCAIENLVVAANAQGYHADVELLPDVSVRNWAGRVHLRRGYDGTSPLFAALPHRHTQRGAYDTARSVDRYDRALLAECAQGNAQLLLMPADSEGGQRWGALTLRATERIVADREMVDASHAWFRYHRREVRQHRDGPTLRTAGLPKGQRFVAGLFPEPSPEKNHEYWLDATRRRHVATAAVWGVLCVQNPTDHRQTLEAGRLWQRLHLTGTALGLALHPMNQVPEIIDRERELQRERAIEQAALRLTGSSDSRPTFVFRAGHARPAPPSPRRQLEEVLT